MSKTSSPRSAVFLDRDGTLTEETHYLTDLAKLRILPGACEALRLINRAGLLAVLITNQSAVARGFLSEDRLEEIHRRLASLFEAEGSRIDAFYYCPHHPEFNASPNVGPCECRKPKPGLLVRAAKELGLDLKRSVMIGDKLSDIEAGHRAGCSSVLVRTGYGTAEEKRLLANDNSEISPAPPDFTCDDILTAVPTILEMTREQKS